MRALAVLCGALAAAFAGAAAAAASTVAITHVTVNAFAPVNAAKRNRQAATERGARHHSAKLRGSPKIESCHLDQLNRDFE
jgi:hypothetical protein